MAVQIDVDLAKARTLLCFLAGSAKKMKLKNQSLKSIHKNILQIKKVCAKSSHQKISHLEKNILDALKKGGFVEECRPCPDESVAKEEIYDIRGEKLQAIEQQVLARAHAIDSDKSVMVEELANAVSRMEKTKKSIKVHSAKERLKFRQVCSRIDLLKKKIDEIRHE